MKITITVNGKQIEAEVDEKAFKEATEKKKPTGYEKTIPIYFYHAPDGFCKMGRMSDNDSSIECASNAYRAANYYSDKHVAENNIRADNLMRNLRRFAAEHGGCVPPKGLKTSNCYAIGRSMLNPKVQIYVVSGCDVPNVLFANRDAAIQAREMFKDELDWYATEYDPMPKEWWDET